MYLRGCIRTRDVDVGRRVARDAKMRVPSSAPKKDGGRGVAGSAASGADNGADKHHHPGTQAPPPLFALYPAASNHPSHSLQIGTTKSEVTLQYSYPS